MGLWDLWHNHQGSGSTWYEEGEKKKRVYIGMNQSSTRRALIP